LDPKSISGKREIFGGMIPEETDHKQHAAQITIDRKMTRKLTTEDRGITRRADWFAVEPVVTSELVL
jgi:hypothetical protein